MNATGRRGQPRNRFVSIALTAIACLAAGTASSPALASPAGASSSPLTTASDRLRERGDHRVVHQDARGDVLRFAQESQASTPAPRDRTTDITTTVVDHRTRRLVVQSRVRHLSRSGYRLLIAEILTAEGKRYELVVDYSTTPIGSRVSLSRFGSGAAVRCPGATWSIDTAADRVGASVPTSCLGGPEWVRVGIALAAAPRDLKTSLADDSRSRGHVGEGHLRLGPRQPPA